MGMDNSRKKVINNMSWLLGGRIVNMILSFFVSLATARYLGPDNFGSINYVAAYVSFFSSITSRKCQWDRKMTIKSSGQAFL